MARLLVCMPGKIDYNEALKIQERLQYLRQQEQVEDIMLLLEHPPAITLGKNAREDNVLITGEELQKQGGNIYKINRGGDVTYHGPGQVVGYPILNLKSLGMGVREYIGKIEATFIRLLQSEYNLEACRQENYRGVWIDGEKITAIGCAVQRGVTMHGFAFNVNTNLEHYNWIVPCGISSKGVTSLQKVLGETLDMEAVYGQVIKHFSEVLNLEPAVISGQELQDILGRG